MDPEIEMKKFIEEIDYLDAAIDSLKALKKRNGCRDCLEEIVDLVDKLKAKKKGYKKSLDELMNEIVAAAEVYSDVDFDALDGESR